MEFAEEGGELGGEERESEEGGVEGEAREKGIGVEGWAVSVVVGEEGGSDLVDGTH